MDARDIVASLRPTGNRIDQTVVEAALDVLRGGQSVAVIGNLMTGRYELTHGLTAATGVPLISTVHADPHAPTSVDATAVVLDAPADLLNHGHVARVVAVGSGWARLTDSPAALGALLVQHDGVWQMGSPGSVRLT